MSSDQNLPATPKRRLHRAAATVAAGRLSNAFARHVSDDADGPPHKRRRLLGARNNSSDFEDPSDVETSSPPNSKSNPIALDSSPDRAPATGSKSTHCEPGTTQVVVELVAPKRSKAPSTARPVSTPASKPTGAQGHIPGTYKTSVSDASSSKPSCLKARRVGTIAENPEIDYITEELMLEIWKEGIDRQAHQYAQEMAKKD